MAAELFEILEGVRRAKLYFLTGRATVGVEVYTPDGATLIEVRDVPVADLLSPKPVIDLTANLGDKIRFLRLENAVARGTVLPRLCVSRGGRGTPIKDVLVIR